MDEPKDIKITIEAHDKTLTLVVPPDQDIYEWKDNFKAILTFLTFQSETIEKLFNEDE